MNALAILLFCGVNVLLFIPRLLVLVFFRNWWEFRKTEVCCRRLEARLNALMNRSTVLCAEASASPERAGRRLLDAELEPLIVRRIAVEKELEEYIRNLEPYAYVLERGAPPSDHCRQFLDLRDDAASELVDLACQIDALKRKNWHALIADELAKYTSERREIEAELEELRRF